MAVSGSKVYVTKATADTVSVIDTANSNSVSTINVGDAPNGVAVNSDGSKVYVANYTGDTVSVIDTTNSNSVSTITVGNGPRSVAVSGSTVYVANVLGGLSVICPSSG